MSSTKRIRVSLACDTCRRKKIKCDGAKPSCSMCKNAKTACVYTQTERVPKTARSRRSKYIAEFDSRLSRIENALERIVPNIEMITELAGMKYARAEDGTLERKRSHPDGGGGGYRNGYSDDSPQSSDNESHNDDKDAESESESDSSQSEDEDDSDTKILNNNYIKHINENQLKNSSPKQLDNLNEKPHDQLFLNIDGPSDKYFGNATPFSVFSPAGLKWINERIDHNGTRDPKVTLLELLQGFRDTCNTARSIWLDPVTTPHEMTLTKEECISLISVFLQGPNRFYGVSSDEEILNIVDEFYSQDLSSNQLRYPDLLLFYSTLAHCKLLPNMPNIMVSISAERLANISRKAIENAIYYYYRVSVFGASTVGLQGIIALIAFFHHSSNPHCVYSLLATCVRFAHELGIHRRESYLMNQASISDTRQSLWQIVYCLDKDISLRCSRPSFIHDADISVNLFKERVSVNKMGYYLCTDGVERSFRTLYAQLCSISSRVMSKLFNASSMRKSSEKIMETVSMLDKELLAWKDSLPESLRPENEFLLERDSPGKDDENVLHVKNFQTLMLLFNYHHIMKTIHSMSIHHPTWLRRPYNNNKKMEPKNSPIANHRRTDTPVNMPASPHSVNSNTSLTTTIPRKSEINPRLFASSSICVHSSRSIIYLLRVFDKQMMLVAWPIAYFPIAAFISLFTNCIQNPTETAAKADLQLMISVIDFMYKLPNCEEGPGKAVIAFFEELVTITENILENATNKGNSQGGETINKKCDDKPPRSIPISTPFGTVTAQCSGDCEIKNGIESCFENSMTTTGLEVPMKAPHLQYIPAETKLNNLTNSVPAMTHFPVDNTSQIFLGTNPLPSAPAWPNGNTHVTATNDNHGPWFDGEQTVCNDTTMNQTSGPASLNENIGQHTTSGNLDLFNDLISYQGYYHVPPFFSNVSFNQSLLEEAGLSHPFSNPDDIRLNNINGMF